VDDDMVMPDDTADLDNLDEDGRKKKGVPGVVADDDEALPDPLGEDLLPDDDDDWEDDDDWGDDDIG